MSDEHWTAEAIVYLYVATGLFEIGIIKPVVSIADCKLSNIFDTVWSTLNSYLSDISHATQIYD